MLKRSEALLVQLQRSVVLYDLGTVETEALTALVSTETASHTQSFTLMVKALLNGLKELPMTLNKKGMEDALIQALLQSHTGVRYAAIVGGAGRKHGLHIYLNNKQG